MATIALTSTLSKLQSSKAIIVRNPWSSRVFVAPRHFSVGRRYGTMATYDDAAKQGRNAAKKVVDTAKTGSQEAQSEALSAVDNAAETTKDLTGKVSETAQDAAGKVRQSAQDAAGKMKQTAQEAWGSVRDTTQKIKDTVVGKTEESAEGVKETVREGAAKMKDNIN